MADQNVKNKEYELKIEHLQKSLDEIMRAVGDVKITLDKLVNKQTTISNDINSLRTLYGNVISKVDDNRISIEKLEEKNDAQEVKLNSLDLKIERAYAVVGAFVVGVPVVTVIINLIIDFLR